MSFILCKKNLGLTFSARRSYRDKIMANADLFYPERMTKIKNRQTYVCELRMRNSDQKNYSYHLLPFSRYLTSKNLRSELQPLKVSWGQNIFSHSKAHRRIHIWLLLTLSLLNSFWDIWHEIFWVWPSSLTPRNQLRSKNPCHHSKAHTRTLLIFFHFFCIAFWRYLTSNFSLFTFEHILI